MLTWCLPSKVYWRPTRCAGLLQGREGVFTAVVEPRRRTALIGAIVLEDLDFLVNCTGQRLVPRHPRYVVSEIE
jgi:hypothetical protein